MGGWGPCPLTKLPSTLPTCPATRLLASRTAVSHLPSLHTSSASPCPYPQVPSYVTDKQKPQKTIFPSSPPHLPIYLPLAQTSASLLWDELSLLVANANPSPRAVGPGLSHLLKHVAAVILPTLSSSSFFLPCRLFPSP